MSIYRLYITCISFITIYILYMIFITFIIYIQNRRNRDFFLKFFLPNKAIFKEKIAEKIGRFFGDF
jgi:hypothetical protein